MHVPQRDPFFQPDPDDDREITTTFRPVNSWAQLRQLSARIGLLFGHLIRINMGHLYPTELWELITLFMSSFLTSLRRPPEVANLEFLDEEYPEVPEDFWISDHSLEQDIHLIMGTVETEVIEEVD
jgi:hypothetical protein